MLKIRTVSEKKHVEMMQWADPEFNKIMIQYKNDIREMESLLTHAEIADTKKTIEIGLSKFKNNDKSSPEYQALKNDLIQIENNIAEYKVKIEDINKTYKEKEDIFIDNVLQKYRNERRERKEAIKQFINESKERVEFYQNSLSDGYQRKESAENELKKYEKQLDEQQKLLKESEAEYHKEGIEKNKKILAETTIISAKSRIQLCESAIQHHKQSISHLENEIKGYEESLHRHETNLADYTKKLETLEKEENELIAKDENLAPEEIKEEAQVIHNDKHPEENNEAKIDQDFQPDNEEIEDNPEVQEEKIEAQPVQEEIKEEQPEVPKTNATIKEGNYEYINYGGIDKDLLGIHIENFASDIEGKITGLNQTAKDKPTFKTINQVAIDHLREINKEILLCAKNGTRLSDQAILRTFNLLAAFKIASMVPNNGQEATDFFNKLNDIGYLEAWKLVRTFAAEPAFKDYMKDVINDINKFQDVVIYPEKHVNKIETQSDFDTLKTSVDAVYEEITKKNVERQIPKEVIKEQEEEQPVDPNKTIVEKGYEYFNFGSWTQDQRNNYAIILNDAIDNRIKKLKETARSNNDSKRINDFAIQCLTQIQKEIVSTINNGGRFSDNVIWGARGLLAIYQIGNALKDANDREASECLRRLKNLSENSWGNLMDGIVKDGSIKDLMKSVIIDPYKLVGLIDKPTSWAKDMPNALSLDTLTESVDMYRATDIADIQDAKKAQVEQKEREEKEEIIEEPVQEEIKEEPVQEEIKEEPAQEEIIEEQEAPEKKQEDKQPEFVPEKLEGLAKQSINALETAKTWVNSDEYKTLIQSIKDLTKPDNKSYTDKLLNVADRIDKYIGHKAQDGVNSNVYKKLAAVQQADIWVTNELSKLNISRDIKFTSHKEYKGIIAKQLNVLDQDKYKEIADAYKTKGIDENVVCNADNCMCRIILTAEEKKRPALINMRSEFNLGKTAKAPEKQKEQNTMQK